MYCVALPIIASAQPTRSQLWRSKIHSTTLLNHVYDIRSFMILRLYNFEIGPVISGGRNISQFLSQKRRRSTFLNYIKSDDICF